jgi:hypothetical protein
MASMAGRAGSRKARRFLCSGLATGTVPSTRLQAGGGERNETQEHTMLTYKTAARAVQEVLGAQLIIECMKHVMPTASLCELALKLEARNLSGAADSPFREKEREAVLRSVGRIPPVIVPFAPAGDKP